ncbi:hypothetical protein [Saccharopolyspora gloriosae]|nr:hypothetical protein [Saccharopolyspora gloriosae]
MTEQKTTPEGGFKVRALLTVSWLWVGIPFALGVYQLVIKAAQLFT